MFRRVLLAGAAVCALAMNSASASSLLALNDAPPNTSGPVSQFYGNINPFYGHINPFYGHINPFYGNISPFWGDITPFWGDINPFYGSVQPFYGSVQPFADGDSDAFWGAEAPFANNPFWSTTLTYWRDAGPQWGAINTTWTNLQSNGGSYSDLQSQLQTFLAQANAFWGGKVQAATGKDFDSGFANAMLAKYGIDPNNPNALAATDAATRSAFFLNFYDGLMSFAGVDHVDWWMPAIHWSPLLTQIQNSGSKSIVGVLDSTFDADATGVANVKFIGGYNVYVNDHGAAVASLIAAQHDGQGVMGIAPNSQIDLYNPFDQTGTASWADVASGIDALYKKGAYVVNASLGTPGSVLSSEWSQILTSSLLTGHKGDLVIVKAAGNDGITQTQNVAWQGLSAPQNLLLVGSVGPTGEISSFSNTPGNACITVLGLCLEPNKLMYHYLVAPGELILVSDGHGGVTRMSGTSFAAPQVTGAVALLQDRWPWLQEHAAETVQIILQSATDLGAPGVDPVYGWGELNVEASQSPLNFNNLTVYQPYTYSNKTVNNPLLPNYSAGALKAAVLNPGQLSLWQQKGAFLTAFEPIGLTYRDFTIPLSSLLAGKNQNVNGSTNPFQSYLYQRLIDWAHGVKSLEFGSQETQLAQGDWHLGMVTTEATPDEVRAGAGPVHEEFVASNPESGVDMRLGEGAGAFALTGGQGFALRSDFDPATGGVNPVLGFASGGMYASGGLTLAKNLHVSIGFSEKSDGHQYMDPLFGPMHTSALPTDRASASVAGIDYRLDEHLSLNASYTNLDEADGLLGSQGSGALAMPGGARTAGTTLGLTDALGGGWTLAGSATMAHTTMTDPTNAMLTLDRDGLDSTSFELVGAKTGVFGEADTLRISLAQPLHVEGGALRYTSLQVTDRQTGALGPVTQSWDISGAREYRMETLYSVPVLEGRGEVAGFTLLDLNPPTEAPHALSVSVGGQFRLDL